MTSARPTEIDVGELIERQGSNPLQRSLLGWSLVLMLFEGFDMQVLAFAAPLISREWGIARADLGPVFGAGLFGYMIGAMALSGLADRYGRKTVVIGGVVLFGMLTLTSIAVASISTLLALRFGAGVGLGASIPALIALNAEYAPARSRASRITLLYVGYCLGGLTGGLLAAQLMPVYGWRSVFIVGGVLPLALAVVLFFVLPESVRLLTVQQRDKGTILTIVRKLAPQRVFTGAEVFVIEEQPANAGLPVRQLFTSGRASITVLLWVAFITSLLGHHFLTAWLPSVLESAGTSLADAVTAGALVMGGAALGALLCGWLLDRRGMLSVTAFFVLSAPIVAAIGIEDLSQGGLLVLAFLSGITLLGAQVGLNAIAGTSYPTFIRSSGAGWALGVGRIGSIGGPVLGGLLIAMGTTSEALFLYASIPGLCAGGLVAALWLLGRRRAMEPTVPGAAAAATADPTTH